MKTRAVSSFIIGILLLSLTIYSIPAQEARSAGSLLSPVLVGPSISPWYIDWVHSNPDASVGSYPSIAFSSWNDQPFISYYASTFGNLILAFPKTENVAACPGNNRWSCLLIDGDDSNGNNDVGLYTSLAFWHSGDHHKLGISYYDATNRALKFAEFDSLTKLWTSSTIQYPPSIYYSIGKGTSLKYRSDGRPFIAYYVVNTNIEGPDQLRLAQQAGIGGNCGEGNATGKWLCEVWDNSDNGTIDGAGEFPSLDFGRNDTIYIAYYNNYNGHLKYCQSGTGCSYVDRGAFNIVGLSPAMLAPHEPGAPIQIAYYDQTNGQLKIAEFGGLGTDCPFLPTWSCTIVDEAVGPGLALPGISAAVDHNGYPIIAYKDAADNYSPAVLKIARPAAAIGQEIGNCGDIPPGGMFQYWYCETLDDAGYGQGQVSVADYTSVAVSSSGLAAIAYRENDESNKITALKIAYQKLQLYIPLIIK